jgi:hypothetical protein
VAEYRRALLKLLRRDAADVIEALGSESLIEDLETRLREPTERAEGKLLKGILEQAGASDPMLVDAWEFNAAAERFYRSGLRDRHLYEAFAQLKRDFNIYVRSDDFREAVKNVSDENAERLFAGPREKLELDRISESDLSRLLGVMILVIEQDARRNDRNYAK